MSYSKKSKYYHYRIKNPSLFLKSTFKTIPIQKTNYKGKYRKKGVLAIVGVSLLTGNFTIQALRIPKKRK